MKLWKPLKVMHQWEEQTANLRLALLLGCGHRPRKMAPSIPVSTAQFPSILVQGGRGNFSAHTHVREGGGVRRTLSKFLSTGAYWVLILDSDTKIVDHVLH